MKPVNDELFDRVNESDEVIGQVSRSEVHGNPSLIHRVVHVLVFNSPGNLYLQKRSDDKDVQPGKWDSSVGGHVDAGESYTDAAMRELSEELGIPPEGRLLPASKLLFLHHYLHRNSFESEFVTTYLCRWDGPVNVQASEISEGRFWKLSEIDLLAASPGKESAFTPNFLDELQRWRSAGSPRP